MNPMMIMSMLPTLIQLWQSTKGGDSGNSMGGKDAQFSSTYGPGAQSIIEQAQNAVKQGFGTQAQDITKNPNYQTGQDWLQSLYNDPSFFNKFEAPAKRQFEEEIIPGISRRFSGMGSGGAQGYTGLDRQLARESGNLETNLAAMRGGMQQQGIPQLMNYAQQPHQNWMNLLQNAITPTQNQYQPATAGFWGDIVSSLTGGATKGLGNMWGEGMANLSNPSGSSNSLQTNVSFPSAGNSGNSYNLPNFMNQR